MPRYWVIAPYYHDAKEPEPFDKVWKYDLEKGIISIGWNKLGDISSLDEQQLRDIYACKYPKDTPATTRICCRMLHNLYTAVKPGDIVIARCGRKKLAGVGTIKAPAYYDPEGNIETIRQENPYPNHLSVQWEDAPRDKVFPEIKFGMTTIYEISEDKYRALVKPDTVEVVQPPPVDEGVEDQTEFVLEKYLEDFIVSNFDAIFKKKLVLFSVDASVAQQFHTDVGIIDILAQDPSSNALVVIELKKGRAADKVVGQILKYMGWVAEKLCPGQEVRGIIICKDPDEKMTYALKMVNNISVKYYHVDFGLQDQPQTDAGAEA